MVQTFNFIIMYAYPDDYDRRYQLDFPDKPDTAENLKSGVVIERDIETIGNDPRTLKQKRRDWVSGVNVNRLY